MSPIRGRIQFGGRAALWRCAECKTWPEVLSAGARTIGIDGYFVLDGKLVLGRSQQERTSIGAAIAGDLDGFLARIDNGAFNIVIHDYERRETRFASDSFGALPLYLARRSDRLEFAATYAGLEELSLQHDPVGLAELYWFGYPLGDRTLYKGVEHMPAGSIVTLRWCDGRETRRRHGRASPPAELPSTRAAAAEFIVEKMRSAVRRLHRSDAVFGAKLSAGMDSRLICGTWPGELRTYTHGHPRAAEPALAKRLAAALRMPHRFVPIQGDFFTTLHTPIFQLHGITEYFHQALLPAMRDDRVEFALDGLAGDVLLGGLMLKRSTSVVRQALGLPPRPSKLPERDGEIADLLLGQIRVPDDAYRPLRAEARAALDRCRDAIRADMTEQVRLARQRAGSLEGIVTEVMFRNRTRRHVALQGAVCRPAVESLYPFLDRDLLALLGRIPVAWVANKRMYVDIYTRLLPAIRMVPGIFSRLPFALPVPAHYAGRVVRSGLERIGMRISRASAGRLHPWAADAIQWQRWLSFNNEFISGARAFLRSSSAFDEGAFDAATRNGCAISGTRFMLTASYCGHFRSESAVRRTDYEPPGRGATPLQPEAASLQS